MSLFHVCNFSACQKVSSNNLIHFIYLCIYINFFIPVQIAQQWFLFSVFFYTAAPLLFVLYSSRGRTGCLHPAKTNWPCRDQRSVKHDLRHELTLMIGNIFNVFGRVLKVWFYVWNSPASVINFGLLKATLCIICDLIWLQKLHAHDTRLTLKHDHTNQRVYGWKTTKWKANCIEVAPLGASKSNWPVLNWPENVSSSQMKFQAGLLLSFFWTGLQPGRMEKEIYHGFVRTDPKEPHPAFPCVTFGLVKNVHCSQISGFCLTTVTVTVAKSPNSSRERGNRPNSHLGGFQLPTEGSSTLFVSLWRETSCGKYYCLLNVASFEWTQQWLFKYLQHHWK